MQIGLYEGHMWSLYKYYSFGGLLLVLDTEHLPPSSSTARCQCALVIAVNGSQLSPVQGHLTSNDDMRGAECTKGQASCLKVGTICSTSHATQVFMGSGRSTSPAETTTLLSLFLPPHLASITSLLLSMLPPQITHTQILVIPSASSKPHSWQCHPAHGPEPHIYVGRGRIWRKECELDAHYKVCWRTGESKN